jgi:putative radical SAM enzyme (TIGR03279 family)
LITVRGVESGSLAERAGFAGGDRIARVNGEPVGDLIDFQVASSEPRLRFEVEREGQVYELEVERRGGEPLGFDFDEMRLRRCNNKCVFCFLHQMPGGMRRSLYFEDDDYRLSFLHGSYVTLTNVREEDLRRIVDQGLTPQYVSVHATDPALRKRLLGRKRGTVSILERIDYLARSGIEMHTQIVLCPGWNDGEHLERTLSDLEGFYPSVRSVALVPVGLTRFRSHLPELQPVTPDLAERYLADAERWGERCARELGERFVYPGDELFLLVGRLPPPAGYYDAFPQIENGIGMVRTFLDCWERERATVRGEVERPLHLALVTGRLASRFLIPMVDDLDSSEGLQVDVVVVDNDFFGPGITVSGLLSGRDMARALSGGPWSLAVLPPNAVNGDGVTLDDLTVAEIEAAAGMPVTVGEYDLAATLRRCVDQESVARGRGRQLSELGFYVGRK